MCALCKPLVAVQRSESLLAGAKLTRSSRLPRCYLAMIACTSMRSVDRLQRKLCDEVTVVVALLQVCGNVTMVGNGKRGGRSDESALCEPSEPPPSHIFVDLISLPFLSLLCFTPSARHMRQVRGPISYFVGSMEYRNAETRWNAAPCQCSGPNRRWVPPGVVDVRLECTGGDKAGTVNRASPWEYRVFRTMHRRSRNTAEPALREYGTI